MRVLQVSLITCVQDPQPGNSGSYKGRNEVAQDKIPWLRYWGLNDSKKENGGRTKGRDNSRSVIDVAKSGAGRHDCFDEKDTAERANPTKTPDLKPKWDFLQPRKRRKWQRLIWGLNVRRSITCEPGNNERQISSVVPSQFEGMKGTPCCLLDRSSLPFSPCLLHLDAYILH